MSSGDAANLARSSGRCVAIPTGHVSRWHDRTIRQPCASSSTVRRTNLVGAEQRGDDHVASCLEAAVDAKAQLVAQPLLDERSPCLHEPELHGAPAFLIDESGLALVPPSAPAMWTSASALTMPAATIPTPASATSFTETAASGFTCRRSKISRARSSIEYVGAAAARSGRSLAAAEPRDLLGDLVARLSAFARLRPCAILICSSSAKTAYSAVTPNRADATCLMRELRSVETHRILAALT